MKYVLLVLFALMSYIASAQEANEKGHFLVEFEKFSPPTKEMILGLEGSSAAPFMAPDIYGTEHFLGNYKGKDVIIWFWSTEDPISTKQISTLNLIQSRYRETLQVVSFAMEEKEALLQFRKTTPTDFPIIPKSKQFGDVVYAGDLGLSRMFIIDKTGMIKKVLPRQLFETDLDVYSAITNILQSKYQH